MSFVVASSLIETLGFWQSTRVRFVKVRWALVGAFFDELDLGMGASELRSLRSYGAEAAPQLRRSQTCCALFAAINHQAHQFLRETRKIPGVLLLLLLLLFSSPFLPQPPCPLQCFSKFNVDPLKYHFVRLRD